MDARMETSDRRETSHIPARQPRLSRDTSLSWLERENSRLTQENQRLRQQCADLAASAELWIGLYEAALRRAGGR